MHVGWQSRSANFKGVFYSPLEWKKENLHTDTIAEMYSLSFLFSFRITPFPIETKFRSNANKRELQQALLFSFC